MQKQKLELILNNRQLLCWRLNSDGENVGERYKWTIRKNSVVPREMFHLILGFVRRRVNQCPDKSFDTIRRAVRRSLFEAGQACGCTPERKAAGGDVAWYLHSEPFIAFQIHAETPTKKRIRKMLHNQALLRWVITINEKGFFKFLPRKTRKGPGSN
jgi:hypothetical protein